MFWIIFHFHICLGIFFISSLIFSVIHWLLNSILFSLLVFTFFTFFSHSWLISSPHSVKFICSNVLFMACVLLLIYFLDVLSTDESGALKFPTVIVLLSIFPFMAISICLIYRDAPVLDACIFTIVVSSSWIDSLILM